MEANNALPPESTQRCILCNRLFRPHPKAQTRQRVCDDEQCQRLRQKLNQLDWVERHPVDYKTWYQDYGKAWRQKNPHYQKQYRQRKKNQQSLKHQSASTQLILQALLHTYQSEKKEQLTVTKTANTSKIADEKKEHLNHNFYLLKAKELVLWSLDDEKKAVSLLFQLILENREKRLYGLFHPAALYCSQSKHTRRKSHAQTKTHCL